MAQQAEDCAAARDGDGLMAVLGPMDDELKRVCAHLQTIRSA
jgi:hypothetical protein